MNQEKLAKMANEFKKRNPRFEIFSFDMIHYGVKAQYGVVLTPEEFKDFLLYMTGHDFRLEVLKDAIDNMPKWLKEMYNR